MNKRLRQLIDYKTAGSCVEFAKLMGWSAAYLGKLLAGHDFGLKPVVRVLTEMKEINARWFLLGEGDMLSDNHLYTLQQNVITTLQSIAATEKYIPVMSGSELRNYEMSIMGRLPACFSKEQISEWEKRYAQREKEEMRRFDKARKEAMDAE